MEGVTTLNQYIISNWVLEYRNSSKSTDYTDGLMALICR